MERSSNPARGSTAALTVARLDRVESHLERRLGFLPEGSSVAADQRAAKGNTDSTMALHWSPTWYKDAIIYEIHVRAFYDSVSDHRQQRNRIHGTGGRQDLHQRQLEFRQQRQSIGRDYSNRQSGDSVAFGEPDAAVLSHGCKHGQHCGDVDDQPVCLVQKGVTKHKTMTAWNSPEKIPIAIEEAGGGGSFPR